MSHQVLHELLGSFLSPFLEANAQSNVCATCVPPFVREKLYKFDHLLRIDVYCIVIFIGNEMYLHSIRFNVILSTLLTLM